MTTATATFRPTQSAEQFISGITARVVASMDQAQDVVVDEARGNAPWLTGELAGSVHKLPVRIVGNQVIGSVVADAFYAAFVEFGTGLRGSGTYPYPLPQSGVPYTGRWIYDYRHIQWKGMPARPFMRPSLDSTRGPVMRCFR